MIQAGRYLIEPLGGRECRLTGLAIMQRAADHGNPFAIKYLVERDA